MKSKKNIDWAEIRQRLEITRTFIETGMQANAAEKKRILKARANALANKTSVPVQFENSIQITEFSLAHEKYAIESSFVREIVPLSDLTIVPCTPSFVLGIINDRGKILSVIDIKKFFDLPEKGLTDLNKIIIVNDEQMEFGILADTILGIRSIPLNEIQPLPPAFSGISNEYLKGLTNDPLIILDVKQILSDPKIIVNETVES